MTNPQIIDHLTRQLEDVLDQHDTSRRYQTLGVQLLSQLRKPIQISFIGFPNSGKTSLVKMMLGDIEVPHYVGTHVVELAYGAQPITIFKSPGAEAIRVDGICAPAPNAAPSERVCLELPQQALLLQSYAEITMSEDPEDQAALLDYAAKASTILVWCSETFGANEQQLWATLPEHIKDHSFLALTMADRQMMKGELTNRIAELEEFVSEQFFGLYPVATLQAIMSRNGTGAQPALWTHSGGAALYDAITRQVSLGRSEDVDRVKLLLEQLHIDPAAQPVPASPPEPKSELRADEPAVLQSSVMAEDTLTNATNASISSAASDSELARKAALKQSLLRLTKGAEEMLGDASAQNSGDSSEMLETCIETVRDMSDLLSGAADGDAQLTQLLEDAQEGENMLLLFQIEKNEEAAADAVTLMLQLKKEITAHAQS